MALTDIIEKINQEAIKEAEKFAHEAEQQKRKLEAQNDVEIRNAETSLTNLFNQQESRIQTKAEMEAEQSMRNNLLRAKRNFIDNVLEKAVTKLANSENYESILTDMIKKMDAPENAEIVPAKGKEEATKNAIRNSGKPLKLSDETAPIKGGFILKTDKIEVDNSFNTIIGNQLRHDLEIKLNKLLFS
jgi:V/A-type H+/Na+-transporting ATPase subunit E